MAFNPLEGVKITEDGCATMSDGMTFCAGFAGMTKVTNKIVSLVKTDPYLLKQARSLSQQESQGINSMLSQIAQGNLNPGISTKVFDGITEFRHKNGGRIYAIIKDGAVICPRFNGQFKRLISC